MRPKLYQKEYKVHYVGCKICYFAPYVVVLHKAERAGLKLVESARGQKARSQDKSLVPVGNHRWLDRALLPVIQ